MILKMKNESSKELAESSKEEIKETKMIKLTHRAYNEDEEKAPKRKLTKEEKLAIAKRIAGSAQKWKPEHIAEMLSIANRDDWD